MSRMTGAEAIVESLLANGIDTVFGLPGGQLDHLFDAIYKKRDRLRILHSRHEQGAAYMAYGYAKSTGKVGVYTVVPGPGLLNTGAALCTAWANYAPVLCISGQIPSTAIDRGIGELHEIPDQLGMIRHITKWAERISHPSHAPVALDMAFKQLGSGAARPVEVEMAMDIMGLETEVNTLPGASLPDTSPIDSRELSKIVNLLKGAKRPLIYLGSGAIPAADNILALAEHLQAPVVAFRGGKGIVPSSHYLSMNFPCGHRLWQHTDAVVAIGTRLDWPLRMWGKDEELKLIRVDIDPEQIDRICSPDAALVADSNAASRAILEAVREEIRPAVSREAELQQLKSEVEEEIRQRVGPQMAYLDIIREELPEDGIFVDEVTQVGFVSWYGFPVNAPRQHISAGYQGTLGYGFATALGVCVANPDKQVLQISGDGGFMFNVPELATAVQYNIPLTTVIFNDNRYTNVQRQQLEWFDGRVNCSDLHNPDFVMLAESFGATGITVKDPQSLRAALRKAFDTDGPVIIEVQLNEFFPAPWPFLMLPKNRLRVCE